MSGPHSWPPFGCALLIHTPPGSQPIRTESEGSEGGGGCGFCRGDFRVFGSFSSQDATVCDRFVSVFSNFCRHLFAGARRDCDPHPAVMRLAFDLEFHSQKTIGMISSPVAIEFSAVLPIAVRCALFRTFQRHTAASRAAGEVSGRSDFCTLKQGRGIGAKVAAIRGADGFSTGEWSDVHATEVAFAIAEAS